VLWCVTCCLSKTRTHCHLSGLAHRTPAILTEVLNEKNTRDAHKAGLVLCVNGTTHVGRQGLSEPAGTPFPTGRYRDDLMSAFFSQSRFDRRDPSLALAQGFSACVDGIVAKDEVMIVRNG
jgi:hypothetical protein